MPNPPSTTFRPPFFSNLPETLGAWAHDFNQGTGADGGSTDSLPSQIVVRLNWTHSMYVDFCFGLLYYLLVVLDMALFLNSTQATLGEIRCRLEPMLHHVSPHTECQFQSTRGCHRGRVSMNFGLICLTCNHAAGSCSGPIGIDSAFGGGGQIPSQADAISFQGLAPAFQETAQWLREKFPTLFQFVDGQKLVEIPILALGFTYRGVNVSPVFGDILKLFDQLFRGESAYMSWIL